MPAFPIGPYELTIKRDRRDGKLRIALRDADYSAVARLTICRPRASVGAGFYLDGDGEAPLGAHLGLGLVHLYLGTESRAARLFARWAEQWIKPKGFYKRRHIYTALDAFVCDGAWMVVGRFFGSDDADADLSVDLKRVLFGRDRYERQPDPERPPERRTLHFAEGSYTVLFTPYLAKWTRSRLPWAKTQRCMEYEVLDENDNPSFIPIPGKGENSWDIDDDGIYSGGMRAQSIDEAAGELYGRVMSYRSRYAGPNWTPSAPRQPSPSDLPPCDPAMSA